MTGIQHENQILEALKWFFPALDKEDLIYPEGNILATIQSMTEYENQFDSQFQLSLEEGIFLSNFVFHSQSKDILELGTWRGASAIYIAGALRRLSSGHLKTVDLGFENSKLAKNNLQKASLDDLVEFVYSDVKNYLKFERDQYDLVFIDADKKNTANYLDMVLRNNLRPGGYVIIDDVINMKDKQLGLYEYFEIYKSNLQIKIIDLGGGVAIVLKL